MKLLARISDIIADFINCMINDKNDKEVIIQRNELADKFNCAPSQINYVLTTRFTIEKGYVIESRRGGGGYIIIKKIDYDSKSKRLELLNEAIGNSLTYNAALSIIEHLYESKFITRKEFELIKISINDRTLSSAENKNIIRAEMLKGMITVILS
ncbi:putative transcriptional regulator CtsR [Clostridium celatum DSM 1785]|uniref:Transcriptional regulator CtsR n=1 Tax=Clostridium celatum DSM 1785 TaxID=545697 RepID=L1QD23_9CLOT|nr:putative transcriptional regulator CtsR [Clostridium celatum DSM 1785]